MSNPAPSPDLSPTPDTGGARRSGVPRWLVWVALGLVGVVVVGYGLIFLYTEVINDSPDELDAGDLDEALAVGATTDPVGATSDASGATSDAAAATSDAAAATSDATSDASSATSGGVAEGPWEWVVTDASELGYRVKEVLFGVDTEGVGRTNQITGGLTIEGTQVTEAAFEVDVATITSDDGRRDNQFGGRIMSTDEFPTATFVLTEPIELGTEAVDGAEATTTATGDLTLRGVTNPVTFDVEARLANGQIGVLGSIRIVFADYEIANPSFGGITTEDEGLLEFVLVFAPVE